MKIELVHDILAKKIYDMASTEDKMLVKVHNFILNRYAYYKDANVLLDQNALNYIGPYVKLITLEKEELEFLKRSKRAIKRRRIMVNALMIVTLVVLFLAGIQAAFNFQELHEQRAQLEIREDQLIKKQDERAWAEQRAQELLTKSKELSANDLEDITVVQQLIIQYDTLGKQQQDIEKERDIAQSATLSDLAEAAIDQDDYHYAFQLAEKSWELNPENEQAKELLADLAEIDEDLTEISNEEIGTIVEEAHKKHKVGKLKNKDVQAIFSKENTVVQKRSVGIKKTIKTVQKQRPKAPKVVKPTLYQSMQQQMAAPTLPAPPRPNINRDCDFVKKHLNKWVPMSITKAYTLYSKYSTEGKLYFQFDTNIDVPLFGQVMFYNTKGAAKVVELVRKENSKGRLLYVAKLTPDLKQLLKKHKIATLAFVPDANAVIQQQNTTSDAFNVAIPDEAQQKFLAFTKCVL